MKRVMWWYIIAWFKYNQQTHVAWLIKQTMKYNIKATLSPTCIWTVQHPSQLCYCFAKSQDIWTFKVLE
jgi:hypothetical protein